MKSRVKWSTMKQKIKSWKNPRTSPHQTNILKSRTWEIKGFLWSQYFSQPQHHHRWNNTSVTFTDKIMSKVTSQMLFLIQLSHWQAPSYLHCSPSLILMYSYWWKTNNYGQFVRRDQPPILLQFHNSCLVWSSHVPLTSHISLCHFTERHFFNYRLISSILSQH